MDIIGPTDCYGQVWIIPYYWNSAIVIAIGKVTGNTSENYRMNIHFLCVYL